MTKLHYLLLFSIIALIACTEDLEDQPSTVVVLPVINTDSFKIDLILEMGKQTLEIWKVKDKAYTKLEEHELFVEYDGIPGVFEWTYINDSFSIDIRSSLIQTKQVPGNYTKGIKQKLLRSINTDLQQLIYQKCKNGYTGGQLLIFPNRNASNLKFEHCMHCPHWMPEVYAQLEIEMNKYVE